MISKKPDIVPHQQWINATVRCIKQKFKK